MTKYQLHMILVWLHVIFFRSYKWTAFFSELKESVPENGLVLKKKGSRPFA
jgi:hypothetical protein